MQASRLWGFWVYVCSGILGVCFQAKNSAGDDFSKSGSWSCKYPFLVMGFFKTLVRWKSFTENTTDNMWSLSQNLLFSAAVLGKLFDPLLFDPVRHNCLWKTKKVKCKMPQAETETRTSTSWEANELLQCITATIFNYRLGGGRKKSISYSEITRLKEELSHPHLFYRQSGTESM